MDFKGPWKRKPSSVTEKEVVQTEKRDSVEDEVRVVHGDDPLQFDRTHRTLKVCISLIGYAGGRRMLRLRIFRIDTSNSSELEVYHFHYTRHYQFGGLSGIQRYYWDGAIRADRGQLVKRGAR